MAKRRKKKDDFEIEIETELQSASIGHNGALNTQQKKNLGGLVDEIERVEDQKRELSAELSEIYKGAKENGFDTKALRHLIKLRRMDSLAREAFDNAVDSYRHAMGDFATTALGQAMSPSPPADTSDQPFGIGA